MKFAGESRNDEKKKAKPGSTTKSMMLIVPAAIVGVFLSPAK
jgi:hypothetical protein